MSATGIWLEPLALVVQRYGHGWIGWARHRPDRRWKGRTASECVGKLVGTYIRAIKVGGLASIEYLNHCGLRMDMIHPEAAPDSKEEDHLWDAMTGERKV